jgi:hypothetical protein
MGERKAPTPLPNPAPPKPAPPPAPPPRRDVVESLARRVEAMTPADKLRLAAGLIEQGEYATARIIAQRVTDELALVLLMRDQR